MKQVFETDDPNKDALARGIPGGCILMADDGERYLILFNERDGEQLAIRLGEDNEPWTTENFISLSDQPITFGYLEEFEFRRRERMSVADMNRYRHSCGCKKAAQYWLRDDDGTDQIIFFCQHYLMLKSDPDFRYRWGLEDRNDPESGPLFQSFWSERRLPPVFYLHRDWDEVVLGNAVQPIALQSFVLEQPERPRPVHHTAVYCAEDFQAQRTQNGDNK